MCETRAADPRPKVKAPSSGTVVVAALGRERRNAVPDDHGDRPANQIGDQGRQPIILAFRRAVFDRHVLAFDKACFLQALAESGHQVRPVSERRAAEEPYHRHRSLLRAHRERPSRRAAI
jgi:hypothetical protein